MKSKPAKSLTIGDVVLKPQHPNGILLARKITNTEISDDGKWVEVEPDDRILHLLDPGDVVAVV